VVLHMEDNKDLTFNWTNVTALDLSYSQPPISHFTVYIETAEPLCLGEPSQPSQPSQDIHFFTLTIPTRYMHLFEIAFVAFGIVRLLEKGIPKVMVKQPYDTMYTRSVRSKVMLASTIFEIFLTFCLLVHLWLALPAGVHTMAENVNHFIVSHTVMPIYDYFSAMKESDPKMFWIVLIVGGIVGWPILIMWSGYIILGLGLAHLSVVIYIIIALTTYVPNLVKNFSTLLNLIPTLYTSAATLRKKKQQ